MSNDSPPSTPLPAARPRVRRAASAAETVRDAQERPASEPGVMASLIGTGPSQYLLGCEDVRSFDDLKAAFDGELQPADPIERMWVDELVDLEWSLHRLRNTRRAVLETRLVDHLVNLAVMARGERRSERLPSPAILQEAARGYIRGVPDARDYIHMMAGFIQLEVELQVVQAGAFEVLSRVEHTIHATSRMRDAILSRLYIRRDAIADGRIVSGRTR